MAQVDNPSMPALLTVIATFENTIWPTPKRKLIKVDIRIVNVPDPPVVTSTCGNGLSCVSVSFNEGAGNGNYANDNVEVAYSDRDECGTTRNTVVTWELKSFPLRLLF